jgi:hypothetical protein
MTPVNHRPYWTMPDAYIVGHDDQDEPATMFRVRSSGTHIGRAEALALYGADELRRAAQGLLSCVLEVVQPPQVPGVRS